MPSSVPSPVTPSGKNYKQTFFDNDVELIREAMKKLTKHVNSVSRISKVNANVKFYSEFQSRAKKRLKLTLKANIFEDFSVVQEYAFDPLQSLI